MSEMDQHDLLQPDAYRVILERYRKEVERSYVEAQRSMNAIQTKIPMWVIVLLVVLGWNEFRSLLRHPFYLLLLVLFASGYYAVHTMQLGTPVVQLGHVVVRQFVAWLQGQLQEFQQPSLNNNRS